MPLQPRGQHGRNNKVNISIAVNINEPKTANCSPKARRKDKQSKKQLTTGQSGIRPIINNYIEAV